jgi:predicted outer membrane repeat protein
MKTFSTILCSCLMATALHAQIIHVPADYPAIQQGINAANPGDTVLVAEGTYYQQINFKGKKPLVVASEFIMDGDTSHINNTILDGSQLTSLDSASLVYFVSGEDTTSALCGFTIRHGKGTLYTAMGETYREGGGVFISSSGAKILHNHITQNNLNNTLMGNTDYVNGAGIGCEWKADPHWVVISDNLIDQNSCTSNNVGANNAGISMYYNSRITGNTVSGNTCTGTGNSYAYVAGIGCSTQETNLATVTAIVEHNVIKNNLSTSQNNQAHTSGVGFAAVKGIFSDNIVENNEVISGPNNFGGCALLFWIPRQGSVARNNVLRENISNGAGALIVQTPETDPNPKMVLVENNYFIDNKGKQGAAVWADVNPIILQNNVFSGNEALHFGGAIYVKNAQPISSEHKIILINNSFFGNKAQRGGALYTDTYRVKPLIINSVFWGDTATLADEIYISFIGDSVEIAYSNINPDLISGHFRDGGGNINTDPLFTDFIKLTPLHTSPIEDAGTVSFTCACGDSHICPQYDILGVPRPWGTSPVDMGAYEYTNFEGFHSESTTQMAIYPNPFTNSVTISYTNDKAGPVLLQIFDNYGRLIAEPVNKFQPQGEQKIEWNGEGLPAGIYFCRLQTGNKVVTNKIVKIY